jgi:hypothetical protein
MYAKAFFDLQLHCADKVATLSGLPFAQALFEYTNLYIRFGLGRDFDPAHPTWREYLTGVENTNDRRECGMATLPWRSSAAVDDSPS